MVLRPGVAAADPALLDHRDVGDAVLLGEVIGGREPVAAAADDDDVVAVLRAVVAPRPLPVLMIGPAASFTREKIEYFAVPASPLSPPYLTIPGLGREVMAERGLLLNAAAEFGITKATPVLFKRQKSTMSPSSTVDAKTVDAKAGVMAKPATGRATLIGISAILMWALLAPLTALTGTLPPFRRWRSPSRSGE